MKKRLGTKKASERVRKRILIFLSVSLAFILFLGAAIYLNYLSDLKRFPVKYEREVCFSSKKHGVDPLLVFSVILIESHFDKNAVSRSGAEGLMQLMPETAEWIAWRQNKEHDKERAREPAYNIDFGCYLLSYLLNYYNGNTEFALAAYNAGKNAVDGWITDGEHFDGRHLSIPYRETRNYVKKVLNAYEKYRELYDNQFE